MSTSTAPSKSSARILFVSHEATRTGAPMFLLHFLRWLRQHTDVSFDLLLAKGGPLQVEFAKLATLLEPKAFINNPALIRNYELIYSNTASNGDLLEEIGCGNVPVLTHVHELDMAYNGLGARNMAGVIRQSSRYIACAAAVADRLKTVFNIPAELISVHYEMIDPVIVAANRAAANATQLRRDFDLPEDAFIVTGCGTFDVRKGPDLFVQMAGRLKRVLGPDRPLRFLWIGAQNSPDLVNLVREDARKLGLEVELRLITELPSPHGLIALSDIFCLTSREDPFPLVMLEAALLEKPVLCFAGAGGAGEFCTAGGGQTVPYLDASAMAELARDLLLDPARRGEMGRQAAAVVRARFTVEAVAPVLGQEVQSHLQKPLAPPAQRHPQVSLADIFRQWRPGQLPQPAFVAAHLARDAARAQAQQLPPADERVRDYSPDISAAAEEKVTLFVDEVQEAQRVKGGPDQVALWDVAIDRQGNRSIFLQPPAALVFTVPTGRPGRLATAIAMHPDMWEKAESGACEFTVRVDGRVAFAMAIDALKIPSDRRWHEIILDIPASNSGRHQVTLETKGIGSDAFRWALWRDPRFSWKEMPTGPSLVEASPADASAAKFR